MILALAAGSGTQLSGSTPTMEPTSLRPTKIQNHCWINGVWYNPCPSSENEPPPPPPGPEVQPPLG
jgi:hypothetical protein